MSTLHLVKRPTPWGFMLAPRQSPVPAPVLIDLVERGYAPFSDAEEITRAPLNNTFTSPLYWASLAAVPGARGLLPEVAVYEDEARLLPYLSPQAVVKLLAGGACHDAFAPGDPAVAHRIQGELARKKLDLATFLAQYSAKPGMPKPFQILPLSAYEARFTEYPLPDGETLACGRSTAWAAWALTAGAAEMRLLVRAGDVFFTTEPARRGDRALAVQFLNTWAAAPDTVLMNLPSTTEMHVLSTGFLPGQTYRYRGEEHGIADVVHGALDALRIPYLKSDRKNEKVKKFTDAVTLSTHIGRNPALFQESSAPDPLAQLIAPQQFLEILARSRRHPGGSVASPLFPPVPDPVGAVKPDQTYTFIRLGKPAGPAPVHPGVRLRHALGARPLPSVPEPEPEPRSAVPAPGEQGAPAPGEQGAPAPGPTDPSP